MNEWMNELLFSGYIKHDEWVNNDIINFGWTIPLITCRYEEEACVYKNFLAFMSRI